MTDFGKYRHHEQQQAEQEGITHSLVAQCHHDNTAKADQDAHHIEKCEFFLEYDDSYRNRENRTCCDEERTDSRRFRETDTISFSHEIYERLEKRQKKELRQVLLLHLQVVPYQEIHDKKYQSGNENADEDNILDRNPFGEQRIAPQIGQPPKQYRQKRKRIHTGKVCLTFYITSTHLTNPDLSLFTKITFFT